MPIRDDLIKSKLDLFNTSGMLKSYRSEDNFLAKNPQYIDEYNLLPDYDYKTKIRLLAYGLQDLIMCKQCDNLLTSFKHKFCSTKCSTLNVDTSKKRADTTLNRYGVVNAAQCDNVKAKVKSTCINKYATYPASKSKRSIEKSKLTSIYRYGFDNYQKVNYTDYDCDVGSIVDDYLNHGLNYVLDKVSFSKTVLYRVLKANGIVHTKSTQEYEIELFLTSLGVDFDCNTRSVIKPYELDFYIPSHNLAIEFNGLFWHSSNTKEDDKKFKNYHLMKTQMCEEQGIQLFHIFENEWADITKREIWKSMIANKLGKSKRIYARKCEIRNISDNNLCRDFLENNHLQGSINNFTDCVGLFYNNELVQLAVYGKGRYDKSLELLRLCSKVGHCVVGGSSRLFKGKSFISYANRRWASTISNVYELTKFSFVSISKPCYYYINGLKINHRSAFQKHKLVDKLESFDPSLTEYQNMYNHQFRRIWDCGTIKYKLRM